MMYCMVPCFKKACNLSISQLRKAFCKNMRDIMEFSRMLYQYQKRIRELLLRIWISQASKDATLLMILQGITQVNNLLATLVVTRYLGPSNTGLISFIQTFIGFTFFLNTGIDNYYIWELASYPEKRKEVVARCFSTKLLLNFLSLLAGLVVLFRLHIPSSEMLTVISSLFVGFVLASLGFVANLTLIEKKVKQYVIAGLSTTFTILILRVAGVYYELPLSYFMAILLGETLLLLAYLRAYNFIHFEDLKFKKDNLIAVTLRELNSAKFYIAIVCTSFIFSRADQLFIKHLLSSTDLGLYASSVRLTELPMVLMTVLTSVIIPRITVANKEETRSKVALLSMLVFAGCGFFFMIMFVIFGKEIINILYGPKFLAASPVLAVYALVLPGLWINSFGNLIFASYNKIKFTLYISIFGSAISLWLLSVLVPIYGLIGAATSAVVSYTVMGFLAALICIVYKKRILIGESAKTQEHFISFEEEKLSPRIGS